MRTRAFAPALIALSLGVSLSRAAEPVPSLDLRGFHVSTDPGAGLYLEPASSPSHLDWNVGLWAHYAHRPITLRDPATDEIAFDVIKHQMTGDLTASIGLGGRVALGFDLPVLIFQSGDDPTAESTRVLGETAIPRQALGDVGLDGKLTLIQPTGGEFGGFALALHERFTLPTGDDASFLGEGHVTSETRLLAEYRLVALGVHLALGAKIRGEEERFACEDLEGQPEEACPTRFGHEIPFGLGFTVRPQAFGLDEKGRWTWFVETHGYVPVSPVGPFDDSRVAEAQLGLGARYAFARDLSLLGGVEAALAGGVGNPAVRGTLSVSWAPRVHDSDDDGVEDEVDQCRELPEDRDGFQDDDGCPEGDNDDDGVPDGEDRCAAEKEDEDGFQDDDGCPDPDNDADGLADSADGCPDEPGPKVEDPRKSGCPIRDPDVDGIEGEKDKCPDVAEDKDQFEDEDGCPEPDNDGDGINDAEDACPNQKGIDSASPKEKGCPDPDGDKDTFVDPEDKCVDKAEIWNGVDDADGCPDEDPKKAAPQVARALVVIRTRKEGPVVEMSAAVKFTPASELDPASVPLVRALAAELMRSPAATTVAVGVRPSPKGGPGEALLRATAVVESLRRFGRRETIAQTAPWDSVKGLPNAEAQGIGFRIASPDAPGAAKPAEAPKPKGDAPPANPKGDAPAAPKPKADAPAAPKPKPKGDAPAAPKPKAEPKPKADAPKPAPKK